MLTAPAMPDIPQPTASRRRQATPLLLSALVHILLALAWLGFPASQPKPDEPASMAVEIVPPPMPPSSPSPKAETRTDDRGAGGELGQTVPQLQAGELAERSSPPTAKAPAEERPKVTAVPEKAVAAPKKKEPVTQNDRDFILTQVVRHWKPPPDLAAYKNADMRVGVTVLPDGHFGEIYDSRRPWNPAEVFDGYQALPPRSIERRTIDALYAAIRKSQPLRLPDKLRAKAPFAVRLDFRFRDAR